MGGPVSAMQPRADVEVLTPREPGTAAPPPSWGEAAAANWRLGQDDEQDYQMLHQVDAYQGLEDELVRMGRQRSRYHRPEWNNYWGAVGWDDKKAQLWRDVTEARRANPKAFAELPATQPEFETWAARRKGARDKDTETAARGGFGTALAPGLGFGLLRMAEPENLLQIPMGGGGRSLAGVLLRQFGAGAAGTVLTTPGRAQARADMGETYGAGDLTTDALLGGVTNAGFVALHAGAGKAGVAAYNQLPWDYRLAQQIKAQIKHEWRTPALQAAFHVIDRAVEVDATSPYHPTAQALDEHSARLQAAMDAVQDPPLASAAVSPAPARVVAPAPAPRAVGSGSLNTEQALRYIVNDLEGGAKVVTDSGGVTKYGISADAHPGVDIAGLSEAQAMEIYRRDYLAPLKMEGLSAEAQLVALDAKINHRGGFAEQLIREAGSDPAKMIAMRRAEYARLIRDDPGQYGRYANGWENRLQKLEGKIGLQPGEAGSLAAGADAAPTPYPDRPDAMDAERPIATAPEFAVRPEVMDAGLVDAARMLAKTKGQKLDNLRSLAADLGVDEFALRGAFDKLVDNGELRLSTSGKYRRLARGGAQGPEDMLRFIANRGGLSYDGFGEGQRTRNLNADNPPKGHDLRNTGNLDHFVPGAGKLLRPTGRGLDEMGELLHDAGYFGPPEITPRPTESELITLLDRVIGGKERKFSSFDVAPEPRATAADFRPPDAPSADEAARTLYWDQREHLDQAAMKFGLPGLFKHEAEAVSAIMAKGTDTLPPLVHDPNMPLEDLAPYIDEWVNREIDDVLEAAYLESENPAYDHATDHNPGEAGNAADGSAGQGVDGRDARPGEAGTGARPSPAEQDLRDAEGLDGPPRFDPATYQKFDDPAGDGTKAVAESLWHDIRASVDPAVAERQAQQAQLGAEAPLRAKAEQDGTMGSPLFDAANEPKFDLEDGKGPRSIASIDAELKAGESGIDAIRGCL